MIRTFIGDDVEPAVLQFLGRIGLDEKNLALISCILLLVLATIVFLFSIGTVFTALPFIGSIANIITVGWLHLWLPLCVVLFLIGLGLCLTNRKKPAHWVALALSVVSLAATVFFLCENASALRQYGVKPNVFLSKENLSTVRVETHPYTRSEYGPVYLDVYYKEDGKADKPVLIYIHGGGWIQGSRETHRRRAETGGSLGKWTEYERPAGQPYLWRPQRSWPRHPDGRHLGDPVPGHPASCGKAGTSGC